MPASTQTVLAAVEADLAFLAQMEVVAGREALGVMARRLGKLLDEAIDQHAEPIDVARYARELRATLVAIGQPKGVDDDDEWLGSLSAAVGDTAEP